MAAEVVGLVGRGYSICTQSKIGFQEVPKPAATNKFRCCASAQAPACSFRDTPSGQNEDVGWRPVLAASSRALRIRYFDGSQLRRHQLIRAPGWASGNFHSKSHGRRHSNVETLTNCETQSVEVCSLREAPVLSCTGDSQEKVDLSAGNVQPAPEVVPGKERLKHKYLLSVAALPSLAAVLYAPLATGDIALHLELKVPDLGVAIFTAAAALVWVRLFDELARRNVFERKLSRKLVHISSGLLFMLFWPVFSANPNSRLYAALVPAANLVRLAAVGTGLIKSEDTVKAISREGDRRELLGGPLYYVIVLIAATVCFWRQSPIGVSALALMCAGDGIADIVGRRFGKGLKLPYNKSKSWAGSAAMFVTGTATALLYVTYFCNFGFYECNMMHTALKVAAIALAATIVESLPITDTFDDNVTVPLTCVAVGSLLFPA